MRKLLCFVLTLAMVLSMVPSVFAGIPDDAGQIISVADGNGSSLPNLGSGITVTNSVAGSAGKDASDLVFTFTGSSSGYNNFGAPKKALIKNVGSTTDYEKEYNFLVIEFNIKPTGDTGFKLASLGGSGNLNVDAVPYSALNQDKWNKVYIYFDYTKVDADYYKNNEADIFEKSGTGNFSEVYDAATIDKLAPYGYVYINGAQYGSARQVNRLRDLIGIGIKHHAKNTSTYTDNTGIVTRFFLTGGYKADFDDVNIYYTNTTPEPVAKSALPVLNAGSGYSVSGTNRTIKSFKPISLAAVKSANPSYTVTAYEDSTCATKLADSAMLYPGNAVTVVNPENDAVCIYTVSVASYYESSVFTLDGSSGLTAKNVDTSNQKVSAGANKTHANSDNYAGWKTYWGKVPNDADEKVAVLYYNSPNDGTHYAYNSSVTNYGLAVDANGNVNYKYIVTKFEVRSSYATPAAVHIWGPNDSNIADVENILDWTKVVVVADYSKIDTQYESQLTEESKTLAEDAVMGSTLGIELDKISPVYKTYVNGKLIQTVQPTKVKDRFGMVNKYYASSDATTVTTENGTGWKVLLDAGNHITYDNMSMYKSNDSIDGAYLSQVPVLNEGSVFLKVNNDGIATDDTAKVVPVAFATVADVKAEYPAYDITVYSNKLTTAETLADDAIIETGNMIRAVSKYTGTFKNFVVEDIVDMIITDGDVDAEKVTASTNNGTTTVSLTQGAGSAGKASTDNVIKYSASALTHMNIGQPDAPIVDENLNLSNKYYIIRFNIKPENNTGFYMAGLGSECMVPSVPATALKQGEWNSVLMKIDYTGIDFELFAEDRDKLVSDSADGNFADLYDEDYIKKISPAGTVYINGKQYGNALYVNRLRDLQFMAIDHYVKGDVIGTTSLRASSGTDARLHINGGFTADFDDVYAYRSDEDVDGAALTALPEITATTDKATVVDGRVTIKSGAALSDLTTNAASVVAYDANATATDFVSGTLLSLVGENNAINTYKVSGFDVSENIATATDVLAGNTIIIAEYDSDDNLVNCAMSIAAADGAVEVTYTPTNAANAVRAYLLDDMATIKPLSTPIVVQ